VRRALASRVRTSGDSERNAGLLVYAPLRVEAAAVRAALPGARVVRCGAGPVRATRTAHTIRATAGNHTSATAIAGVCGALDPELRPGDVVVASEIRGPTGTRELPASALVLAALRRLGVRARSGPVVSVDHVVRGRERRLLRDTGAIALDMESAWLAPADGPFAVLRVVADTPSREVLDPRIVVTGTRALRTLSRAVSALADWGAAVGRREVVLCGPRSFCAGVERAVEIVERALGRFGPPVYVRKQIIHNVHVVRQLEERGAVFVDELADVPDGGLVVFSAHGVAPRVRAEATARGLRAIDATCPLVSKVHAEARRFAAEGYRIVLIGHEVHEEVEGTIGEAPDAIQVIDRVDAVASIEPDNRRVAYLTQTTLAIDETREIVAALRERFPDLVGPASDDICYATQNRQDAVRAVAGECDLMLVIGSQNSSNSRRLVEVAERAGCVARLIDDETELDPVWLRGTTRVGITAGASAPEVLVERVLAALAGLGPVQVTERAVVTESVRFRLPAEVR